MNHWDHQLGVAETGGAQNGPQLSAEQARKFRVNTYRAIAEERVLFLGNVEVRNAFIAADVHRAEDNRLVARRQ